MQSYEEVAREVDSIVDSMGEHIDGNIKKIVIALRMAGFPTSSSCEGHTNWGLPYPWVEVYALEQEGVAWKKANNLERKKMQSFIEDFNKSHKAKHHLLLQNIGIFGAFRLQNVTWGQNAEADLDKLLDYQKEMDSFAEFIFQKLEANN